MLFDLLDLLLPAFCLGCGTRLAPEPPPLALCAPCRARLTQVDPRTSCASCARPLPSNPRGAGICGACRAAHPSFDRLVAVWKYRAPASDLVQALKFGRCEFLAEALGRELANAVLRREETIDLVAPLPLHWTRRLARGFDQSEALAGVTARALRAPFARLLVRRSRTRPQSGLSRAARRGNVTGAFVARPSPSLAGRRVLLIDDVFTTGSTARAAAAELRRAGAAAVVVAVVATTPFDDLDRIPGCAPSLSTP